MTARRVLVTGAGGYVGRHVVDALLARHDEVLLVAPKGDMADPRTTHLATDFRDALAALDGAVPDSCIHLAWRDGFQHFADSHMSNLSSHFDFLTSLTDAGVTSLTVLGSMHEVGYWEGPVDANTPTRPQSLYGIAKNALRQALTVRLKSTPVDFRWIRAFYIMGDDATNQSIFAKILSWEAEGKATFPFTSGLNKYDFIDVRDLARQIVAADAQNAILGVINCCTGEPETLRSRVERFLEENGLRIRPEYGAFPDRLYDSPAIWGDATDIRAILDLQDK